MLCVPLCGRGSSSALTCRSIRDPCAHQTHNCECNEESSATRMDYHEPIHGDGDQRTRRDQQGHNESTHGENSRVPRGLRAGATYEIKLPQWRSSNTSGRWAVTPEARSRGPRSQVGQWVMKRPISTSTDRVDRSRRTPRRPGGLKCANKSHRVNATNDREGALLGKTSESSSSAASVAAHRQSGLVWVGRPRSATKPLGRPRAGRN